MKHEASVYAFSAPSFPPPSRAAETMDVEGGDEPPDSEAIGEENGVEDRADQRTEARAAAAEETGMDYDADRDQLDEALDRDAEKKRLAIAEQMEKDRLAAMKVRELEARSKRFGINAFPASLEEKKVVDIQEKKLQENEKQERERNRKLIVKKILSKRESNLNLLRLWISKSIQCKRSPPPRKGSWQKCFREVNAMDVCMLYCTCRRKILSSKPLLTPLCTMLPV